MQLGITIPMERFFKMKKPPYGKGIDDLFCWELHVIMLQGRPSLIGINCGTRFGFIRADIETVDKEQLEAVVLEEIKTTFEEAGISPGYTQRYVKKAELVELTKTHGRSQVAYLNKAVDLVLWNDIAADSGNAHQSLLCDILNQTPTRCTGDTEMERPVERLLEKLEKL